MITTAMGRATGECVFRAACCIYGACKGHHDCTQRHHGVGAAGAHSLCSLRSSPWSNEYDPPLEDGTVPSLKLRKLEITANEAFDTYREMYVFTIDPLAFYTHGARAGTTKAVSLPYFCGTSMTAASRVSCCSRKVRRAPAALPHALTPPPLPPRLVLNATAPGEPSGSWDSIHVFEAAERGRQAHYKLTSTVMLQMTDRAVASGAGAKDKEKEGHEGEKRAGEVVLSGSMTRQVRPRAREHQQPRR